MESSGPAVALSLKSHIMRTFTLKSQHAFGVWIALQQKSSDTPVGGPTCVFDMNIALGVHGKGKVHDFKGSSGIGFMSTQPIDSFVLAMMAPSPQTDVVYPGFTFAAQVCTLLQTSFALIISLMCRQTPRLFTRFKRCRVVLPERHKVQEMLCQPSGKPTTITARPSIVKIKASLS